MFQTLHLPSARDLSTSSTLVDFCAFNGRLFFRWWKWKLSDHSLCFIPSSRRFPTLSSLYSQRIYISASSSSIHQPSQQPSLVLGACSEITQSTSKYFITFGRSYSIYLPIETTQVHWNNPDWTWIYNKDATIICPQRGTSLLSSWKQTNMKWEKNYKQKKKRENSEGKHLWSKSQQKSAINCQLYMCKW